MGTVIIFFNIIDVKAKSGGPQVLPVLSLQICAPLTDVCPPHSSKPHRKFKQVCRMSSKLSREISIKALFFLST